MILPESQTRHFPWKDRKRSMLSVQTKKNADMGTALGSWDVAIQVVHPPHIRVRTQAHLTVRFKCQLLSELLHHSN